MLSNLDEKNNTESTESLKSLYGLKKEVEVAHILEFKCGFH